MTRISLVERAHALVGECVKPGDVVVDATLGNGHDAAFLAQCVGAAGTLFGFDVQARALENTRSRLREDGFQGRAALTLGSHADMASQIPPYWHGKLAAVMFNLGYLPGGDKAVVTTAAATLTALETACRLLASTGILTVLAYPGHPGGDIETERLTTWCHALDPAGFAVERVASGSDKPTAPRLFAIRKRVDLI